MGFTESDTPVNKEGVVCLARSFGNGTCSNGGALSSIGVSWVVLNSVLSHNTAVGHGANPARAGTPGGGSGGAIYCDGNTFTVRIAGSVVSDNDAQEGGGAVFFVVMYDTFGREFHDKLASQKLSFARDIPNSERRVARGEFPIYIPFSLQDLNNLKGLPVKAIVPAEGRPYVRFDLTMLKNAPHPNAARLFMNYYLEPESQLVFANAGYNPVIKGVIEKTSEEIRPLLATKAMGTTIPERQDEMLELAKQIYK